MDFIEMINQLQNPGDTGVPETIYSDLTTLYQGDIAAKQTELEQRETRIQELEKEIEQRDSKIVDLTAHNYDMLKRIPGSGPAQESGNTNDDGGPKPLFTYK